MAGKSLLAKDDEKPKAPQKPAAAPPIEVGPAPERKEGQGFWDWMKDRAEYSFGAGQGTKAADAAAPEGIQTANDAAAKFIDSASMGILPFISTKLAEATGREATLNPERLKLAEERSPYASAAGTVAGTLIPGIGTSSLLAKGGAKVAEKVAAPALKNILMGRGISGAAANQGLTGLGTSLVDETAKTATDPTHDFNAMRVAKDTGVGAGAGALVGGFRSLFNPSAKAAQIAGTTTKPGELPTTLADPEGLIRGGVEVSGPESLQAAGRGEAARRAQTGLEGLIERSPIAGEKTAAAGREPALQRAGEIMGERTREARAAINPQEATTRVPGYDALAPNVQKARADLPPLGPQPKPFVEPAPRPNVPPEVQAKMDLAMKANKDLTPAQAYEAVTGGQAQMPPMQPFVGPPTAPPMYKDSAQRAFDALDLAKKNAPLAGPEAQAGIRQELEDVTQRVAKGAPTMSAARQAEGKAADFNQWRQNIPVAPIPEGAPGPTNKLADALFGVARAAAPNTMRAVHSIDEIPGMLVKGLPTVRPAATAEILKDPAKLNAALNPETALDIIKKYGLSQAVTRGRDEVFQSIVGGRGKSRRVQSEYRNRSD